MWDKIDFNSALEDCKRVRDGIKSDDDFQNADSGLVMYYLNTIVQALEIATTVKHGTWKRTDMFVKCSECGVELLDEAFFGIRVFDNGYMPFCPCCCAKMNGVDAE